MPRPPTPIQALKNLEYLQKTVVPHLERMPTKEDYHSVMSDTSMNSKVRNFLQRTMAFLNFGDYVKDIGRRHRPITDDYNCGRHGCLAGWYVMMSKEDERISETEQTRLNGFSTEKLGIHFGISELQADRLFSTLGGGCEDEYADTSEALQARKQRLASVVRAKRKKVAAAKRT